MEGAATRGQPAALAAVGRMVAGAAPHALLLVGPAGVGKTTLALDLAAGLLCDAPDAAAHPCRRCRGCRMVQSGNHPDLHRLAPEGPGGQVRLGDPHHPEPGTVRHLVGELALLPVEGGARVAIVEAAHRLNEDGQHALLKTLEEPPPGVTIVLCADDEEALLPTIRSRCVRLRLGPVAARAIEGLLAERGVADAPTAARLARLVGGRPGLALAYAAAPESVRRREALARQLLDLLATGRRGRLVTGRALLAEAAALAEELAAARERLAAPAGGASVGIDATPMDVAAGRMAGPRSRGGRPARSAATAASDTPAADSGAAPDGSGEAGQEAGARLAPADRRRAAATLLDVWSALARDLAVAAAGGRRALRDPALLEELEAAAASIPSGAASAFLARLGRAAELLDQNANPELLVDVLALRWPRASAA
ncbi:MAG TPA: ATP-binding protein [Candidatus Limnocylindrales bacterium]